MDPAVAIVNRLQREFPDRDLHLTIDRRQHGGSSRKVSNLINMMPHARHDFLVLSDSDVRVKRDYLAKDPLRRFSTAVSASSHAPIEEVRGQACGRSWGRCSSMNGSYRRYVWRHWPARDRSRLAQP